MAGQVKDREAFQRLNFLYQGPLCEEDALSRLLLSPHPWPHLHAAPETPKGTTLDSTDLSDMPAKPAVPQ
ncbi:ribonuclease P 21 subunit (human), isoform CRA_d [Rattus norvegicus]|nr:ribonuclease P 21 subunit (human), isoform CRA_d [Rattus norvegicus]